MDCVPPDLCGDDRIVVLIQSIIGKLEPCWEATDQKLRDLAKSQGTSSDDLAHNIKVVSSLKAKLTLKALESVRSSTSSTHVESLRLFFVEAVFQRILLTASNRGDQNEETLVLLYLTAVYVGALIELEQSFLSSTSAPSVYTNEHLAILQSMLFTLLGLCTEVSESFANMIKENAQETMLLLRQSAPKVGAPISKPSTVSPKVSIIQEVSSIAESASAEENASPEFQKLSEGLRIPASYRANYTSTALLPSLQPITTNTNSAFKSIVSKAISDLSTLCGTISTNRASRSSKLGTKSSANTDSIIREDSSAVLTQSIINIARCWNASENSVHSDKLAAHAILCLLNPDSYVLNTSTSTISSANNRSSVTVTLTSAAYTALVPIAMRLLDRYEPPLHTLGLLLLYKASDATPPGLLSSFLDWVLPHLFTYLEIGSDDWSRLVEARLIHSLLCCDIQSNVALKHAHLYIESSIRQLQLKPTAVFAWPYLLHMNCMYIFMTVGVLSLHASALVDCYLQLLNVWHLPLQNLALESLSKLVHRLAGSGLEQIMPKIATELVRINLFYASTQRDISSASASDRSIIMLNSVVLGKQLRRVSSALWDNFLQGVLDSMLQTTSTGSSGDQDRGRNKNSRTKGADEHVIAVLEKFQSEVAQ
eukprot:gene8550-10136_t